MATSIVEQPQGNMGANSPIIYQASSTAYANDGFYYQFKVYIWNGTTTLPSTPIATIQRLPDQFGAGRGWIDIHQYVLQYLNQNNLNIGTYKPNINDGCCRIAIKVKGIWNTGTDTEITSNVRIATLGWSYALNGFNYNFSGKVVYTDKTALYITPSTTNYYLYFDATQVLSISAGSYSTTPNTPGTSSNSAIQGIDIVKLLTDAGLLGQDTTISFITDGGTISFPLYSNCVNRYGEVVGHFINRYGVYETLSFNAVSKKTKPFERESYESAMYRQSNLQYYWGYGLPITNEFLVNAKTNLMVNTNWIPEAYNTVIEQLMISQNVLINDNGNITSARIMDSSFNELKRVNDKLINYTLNLEFNQPLINKIVR